MRSTLAVPFAIWLSLAAIAQERSPAEQLLRQKTALLRASPKYYGTLVAADQGRVEVRMEEDGEIDQWPLDPDAEIKVHGWWGRVEDLEPGDRVWLWARLDEAGEPAAIAVLADEISEQHIHDVRYELSARDGRKVVLKRALTRRIRQTRELELAEGVEATMEIGAEVYVQSRGDRARLLLSETEFEAMQAAQRSRTNDRFEREGLPGTTGFVHAMVGEVEVFVDHAAMRWARHLEGAEMLELHAERTIPVVVTDVRPFHEKTRVTLATAGQRISSLRPGRRVRLSVPRPPVTALTAVTPPDAGRERSRAERIEWFLASIYCACSIAGDGCTGQFYTLASCNPATCGMPDTIRGLAGEKIDQGWTDAQLFAELQRQRGAKALRPHLLK